MQAWDGNFPAQHGIEERNIGFIENIIVLAGKLRVGPDGDQEIQVARRAAVQAGVAFAAHPQPGAGIHSRRYFHFQGFGAQDHAPAATAATTTLRPSARRRGTWGN